MGSPERVADQINQIAEMLTLDQIIWQIDFGAQPEYVSRRTVELFIEKVMPRIHSHIKEENSHAA